MPRKPDHEIKEPTDSACMGWKAKGKAYCKKPPGWGTWHAGVGRCKLHGGANPDYASEVYRLRAIQSVNRYALPIEIDPQEALIQELARTNGLICWLEFKVNQLEDSGDESNMVGPVGGAQGGYPEYKPNVYYNMLQGERKHFIDVSKACISAGIEERRVRLAEQQGALIAKVIQGILKDLEVDTDPRAPKIVREHLTLVASEGERLAA